MSVQKRPYELSVWNEELIGEGKKAETKMLIIGADTMTYDGRATGIKLVRKVNGTNTLTFQMLDSFFDSKKGEFVKNDYIDEQDHVTDKYRADKENNVLAPVPESCTEISEGVHALIQSIFDPHALDDMIKEDDKQTKIDNIKLKMINVKDKLWQMVKKKLL